MLQTTSLASGIASLVLAGVPGPTVTQSWFEVPFSKSVSVSSTACEGVVSGECEAIAHEQLILPSEATPKADRRGVIIKEIKCWEQLGDGWDGPESFSPNRAAISEACKLVEQIPNDIPLPRPMISSSGDIGLYWDLPDVYADIEFEDEGVFSLFSRNKETNVEQFVEETSEGNIPDQRWYEFLALNEDYANAA